VSIDSTDINDAQLVFDKFVLVKGILDRDPGDRRVARLGLNCRDERLRLAETGNFLKRDDWRPNRDIGHAVKP